MKHSDLFFFFFHPVLPVGNVQHLTTRSSHLIREPFYDLLATTGQLHRSRRLRFRARLLCFATVGRGNGVEAYTLLQRGRSQALPLRRQATDVVAVDSGSLSIRRVSVLPPHDERIVTASQTVGSRVTDSTVRVGACPGVDDKSCRRLS
jgi:hypothetical protein